MVKVSIREIISLCIMVNTLLLMVLNYNMSLAGTFIINWKEESWTAFRGD